MRGDGRRTKFARKPELRRWGAGVLRQDSLAARGSATRTDG